MRNRSRLSASYRTKNTAVLSSDSLHLRMAGEYEAPATVRTEGRFRAFACHPLTDSTSGTLQDRNKVIVVAFLADHAVLLLSSDRCTSMADRFSKGRGPVQLSRAVGPAGDLEFIDSGFRSVGSVFYYTITGRSPSRAAPLLEAAWATMITDPTDLLTIEAIYAAFAGQNPSVRPRADGVGQQIC